MIDNNENYLDLSLNSFIFNDDKNPELRKTIKNIKEYNFNNIYVVNSLNEYILFFNSLLLQQKEKGYSIMTIGNGIFKVEEKDDYRKEFVFRGISDVKDIKPSLTKKKDYSDLEFEFIKKFEENASLKLGQFNNPIDLAAAAQHHGVKTRLIDYTHSILIASLFALHNDNKDFYAVIIKDFDKEKVFKSLPYNKETTDSLTSKYGSMIECFKDMRNKIKVLNKTFKDKIINTPLINFDKVDFKKYLNEVELEFYRNELMPYISDLVTSTNVCPTKPSDDINVIGYALLKALISDDESIFLETNYSNERITAQRGLFEIYENEEQLRKNKKDILFINKSARKEIIKYINRLGINYYLLMNDPTSCSNEVNRDIIGELTYTSRIE